MHHDQQSSGLVRGGSFELDQAERIAELQLQTMHVQSRKEMLRMAIIAILGLAALTVGTAVAFRPQKESITPQTMERLMSQATRPNVSINILSWDGGKKPETQEQEGREASSAVSLDPEWIRYWERVDQVTRDQGQQDCIQSDWYAGGCAELSSVLSSGIPNP